jgi:DNA-binding GntR family transcriptional regulator
VARPIDVRQRLRDDVVAGVWPFGARLTIDELASRYGVSHMPIREALRELSGEGLIVTEPNRGARIRPVDQTFVENLFEIRSAIEVMLTKRAAQRRTSHQLQRLAELEDELEARIARADFAGVLEANRAFHQVINEAADNPDAVILVDRHWLLIAALWRRYGYGAQRFAGVVNDHRHLLRAIEARDADAAAVIMGAHVTKAKQELLGRMMAEVPIALPQELTV